MNTFPMFETGSRRTTAVENAKEVQREEAQLRLARIQNGADPADVGGCTRADRRRKRRAKKY
jgi:hypothetical protein